MYLPVDVYVSQKGHDCSLNGITTQGKQLVVPCEGGHVTQELVDTQGYVVLELEHRGSAGYCCFKQKGDTRWLSNGGNFVYACDSRFRRQYGHCPIPVHDRYEG